MSLELLQKDEYAWLLILLLAVGAHVAVLGVRRIGNWASNYGRTHPKIASISSLATSILIFVLYFGAFGLGLRELGVSLTAYLASASVIGLAVGFGAQGLVQDVVTGLTLVFSDLFDVGDMVEIGGQVGIIRSIGIRFTILENGLGAEAYIPNRSITNVVNYPRGYVRCLVDVTLGPDSASDDRIESLVSGQMEAFTLHYPGIMVAPPSIEGRMESGVQRCLRVKFRLWPGRGGPVETTFRSRLTHALKETDPDYSDWMITVSYETERDARRLPVNWRRLRRR